MQYLRIIPKLAGQCNRAQIVFLTNPNVRSSMPRSTIEATAQGDGKEPLERAETRYDKEGIEDTHKLRDLARSFSQRSTISVEGNASFDAIFPPGDTRFDPSSDDFDSTAWAGRMANVFQGDRERYPRRELGVSWRKLRAYGFRQDTNYQVTVGNLPLVAAEKAGAWLKTLMNRSDESSFTNILKPQDGIVKPGELVMVLGRPGAGCSTYLRSISGRTYGFHLAKESELNYHGLKQKAVKSHYRTDLSYCAESELNFAGLTVAQTLLVASRLRTPANHFPGISRLEYAKYMRDVYMAVFGLSIAADTKVGNDMIRGVSGGERKRVSIAELAISGAALQCWDNPTRGLDSATANEFIRTLRTSAHTFGTASLVAIYQASDEIFQRFDRVQLLYDGYQIYYGPCNKAVQYFYDQGWQPKPRQSAPDFLTSITQPTERITREGFEDKVPRTAQEFREFWERSVLYRELIHEIEEYNEKYSSNSPAIETYKEAFRATQQPTLLRHRSAYTVGLWEQTKILTSRAFQRIRGDPAMTIMVVWSRVVMGLIVSSMFYDLQPVTSSFYRREAAVYFGLMFQSMSAMLEIFTLFESRDIVQKHHNYGFYHPAVDAISAVIADLPAKILSSTAFSLILYFMVNLRREPGRFFFFLLVTFISMLFMSFFFRTLAAAAPTVQIAMVPATVILMGVVMYTGFVIPITRLEGTWSRWINYIDPLAYSYESLMSNEFHGRAFECDAFVPLQPGQGATGSTFACSTPGSNPGDRYVQGERFLELQYQYKNTHKWRNVGIIIGYTAFLLGTYLLVVCMYNGPQAKGEILVYPRSILKKILRHENEDDEGKLGMEKEGSSSSEAEAEKLLEKSDDIYYWKDVCYDVKVKGGERRLLNYVDGWVKPGTLTALMGATGAGKTTLLDVLANRVGTGVVHGHMLVNGEARDNSFQRTTGYAMQQDLHLPSSTVREALVFSAVLRQSASTPYEDKIAYVDNIIEILEMRDYADAVVGVQGKGLNIEQRKRLTIGVELVAKPKLLLFLDEPTSGLDSQTAWSVSQLLKKLSSAGQAILCTIHQPSALLLQEFDNLLFLAKGGRTVYFGPLGDNSNTLTGYFEKYGAKACPSDANPAEWMLEVIGAAPGSKAERDYAEVWLKSSERRAVRDHIDSLMDKFGAKENNKSTQDKTTQYAASFWTQYKTGFLRTMQFYWRTPFYIFAKLFLSGATAVFNGFSFWDSDLTTQGLQNEMFSVFLFAIVMNSTVQQYIPMYTSQRNLFEARERPSKTWGWAPFILTLITTELPWQTLSSVLGFFAWYYPSRLFRNARHAHEMTERGGLTFFYVWLFYILAVSFAQLTAAPMENAETGSNLAMLLFMMSLLFSGVLSTREAMPHFWVFMNRVSPMTYWIGGMVPLAVANNNVTCADYEYIRFYPPEGENCQSYVGPLLGKSLLGYLGPESTDGECAYCSMSTTNQYLASVDMSYHYRWRNIGFLFVFISFNIGASVILYYVFRVPKSKTRLAESKNDTAQDPAMEEFEQKGGWGATIKLNDDDSTPSLSTRLRKLFKRKSG